jgi:hypothetical protein
VDQSWEQLQALAAAHRKKDAVKMLRIMVAAQGDNKSWTSQQKQLMEVLE